LVEDNHTTLSEVVFDFGKIAEQQFDLLVRSSAADAPKEDN